MANASEACSILFLVLYASLFCTLIFLYATKKIKWLSRYSMILFHVTVRLAAEATGIVFAIVGFSHWQWLVAYMVLSAEGYFTLVLCDFRFLVSWHQRLLGKSWMEPIIPRGTPFGKRYAMIRRSQLGLMDTFLILANVLIIVGGSLMSSGPDVSDWQHSPNVTTGKIMRAVGQAAFLAMILFFAYSLYLTFRRAPSGPSSYLLLQAATVPLLVVRGVYGILSAADTAYNLYNPSLYSSDGFSAKFLVVEYVMGASMEWLSCLFLLMTHFTEDGQLVTERPVAQEGESQEGESKEGKPQEGHFDAANASSSEV